MCISSMNKKSRFCIVTCSALLFLFSAQLFYLQLTHTLTQKELTEKRRLLAVTTVSNLNLAIKNGYIKRLP